MSDVKIGHVELRLRHGYVALVDAADIAFVSGSKWYVKEARYPYVFRCPSRAGGKKKTTEKLHRLLMAARPGEYVDHINGDPLDNRRANLRIATSSENHHNLRRSRNQQRGEYKGVSFDRRRRNWRARITLPHAPGERPQATRLGTFTDVESAARAYDAAAIRYFGEFAFLNFPPETEGKCGVTDERKAAK